jgi:hypothetical protein
MKRNPVFLILFLLVISFISAWPLAGQVADSVVFHRKISIAAVGDIMLGSNFPNSSILPPDDNPLLLLGNLADTLASSDIAFGNLEGSFLDSGEPAKKCRDTTICYLFRMPERYAGTLAQSGFDIVNLANNHFGDFGFPARLKTIELLDSLGINYGGIQEHPYSIFRKDSILYGFCAFSPNAGTMDINDTTGAEAIVKKLADTCDIVIVAFHGGAEGADFQHVPKCEEIFYGENRGNVHAFAHRMIDAGADVVFGSGPHVPRAIEVYKERFIAYSLGNFCTYGRFNIMGPNGLAPLIKVEVDSTGRFLEGRIIPCIQSRPEGVRIDPERRVINKIRDLTASDFPDAVVDISENGYITHK